MTVLLQRIMGAALALLLGLGGFAAESEAPAAAEDEFIIGVRLETADEVCMLSCEYMLDGEPLGGGTVCCADMRTPLRGTVYESFEPEYFPEGAELDGFSIVFYVNNRFDDGSVTEQDGAVMVENEIFIPARYGENYTVVISGDRESGYRAS